MQFYTRQVKCLCSRPVKTSKKNEIPDHVDAYYETWCPADPWKYQKECPRCQRMKKRQLRKALGTIKIKIE